MNTKKEGCSLEELIAILVKEEDDINLNRSRSVAMVSHQVDKSKKFSKKRGQRFKRNGKKIYGMKSRGSKDGVHHMKEMKGYCNGRCSYCKKVRHKKIDC